MWKVLGISMGNKCLHYAETRENGRVMYAETLRKPGILLCLVVEKLVWYARIE
jgi:hypothetical protein